ncbi:LysR family transcriptional regulator [Parasalinivibrio latis]|uniref:LysR family transcriptional regulator n=1 Tax=Parasalinivibrio latis TaxID=2952610 RepID=UPI0030E18A16
MNINWQGIHYFMMVVEAGSLSKAASRNNLSQPTLSRKIQELESQLGYALFTRNTQGLVLTDEGSHLVEAAGLMSQAADQFSRIAMSNDFILAGDIRISANEIVGHYLLPEAIAAFQREHPEISCETVIDNRATNLSKRDADIAIRMFQPLQPDLVCRRLPDMPLGFFAHKDYISKYGKPATLADLRHHRMIGFDQVTSFIDQAAKLGFDLQRGHFQIRSDSLVQHIYHMKAGAGIAVTHKGLAAKFEEIYEVAPNTPLPVLPVYLTAHQDVSRHIRLRTFMRFLGDWFNEKGYNYKL